MNTCPTPEELLLVLKEMMPKRDHDRIMAHIEECAPCQAALEAVAGGERSWETTTEGLKRDVAAVNHKVERMLEKLRPDREAAERTDSVEETPGSNPVPEVPGTDATDLSFLQPATKPDALGRLGHYEVYELLGKGGFGIVVRAFDEKLQRMVAIKVLAPHLATMSPARKRFMREAQSSARIRHENVVLIHAIEEGTPPYLVMEYIPGETLQQRINDTGPLPVADTLRVGAQIARGLAAAHAVGMVHRDIKPANILLENGLDRIKITDFGLARAADDASHTQSGMIAGTPMYMSPEQAEGHAPDHRGDLFSLGSVLYVMCSGRPPFRAASTLAVLKRVAEDTPRAIREIIPEVPPWLCDIIAKLHAKKPDDRFQSAREVAEVLEQSLTAWMVSGTASKVMQGGNQSADSKPSATGRAGLLPGKRGGMAVVAVVLVVAVAVFAWTEATGLTHVLQSTGMGQAKPDGAPVADVVPFRQKDRAGVADAGVKTPATASDRRAAAYVLAIGGSVQVNDQGPDLRDAAELPKEPFRLTKVNLYRNAQVSDEGLAVFRGCHHLKNLDLGEIATLSDAGLAHFKDCKHLSALSLYHLKQVTDAGLLPFKDCKHLEELNLNGVTQMTDAGLSYFKDCKHLRHLALNYPDLTDGALAQFRDCKQLERLILAGHQLTDAGLVHFQDCHNLTVLILNTPQITDAGLGHFKHCKNLMEFQCVNSPEVTNLGVAHFKDCNDLTALVLAGTKVDDGGLALFKNCKHMTRLTLVSVAITDASVETLCGFAELKYLTVKQTQVTEAGLKKIADAVLPCRIEHDQGVIEPRTTAR